MTLLVRVLTDESALYRDLEELMPRLIPQLRKCERPAELASFLVQELPDDQGFYAVSSFGLRGNNSAQVKYLLARLTAFAQTGWGEQDLTASWPADGTRLRRYPYGSIFEIKESHGDSSGDSSRVGKRA